MLQRPIFAYDPASQVFAISLGVQTVQLWNLSEVGTGREECPIGELSTGRSALKGLALTKSGELVTVHETGLVFGWALSAIEDTTAGEPAPSWEYDAEMVVCEVTTQRGNAGGRDLLALGGEGGEITMLRFGASGTPTGARVPTAHRDKIEVLAISDDESLLASSARDREIAVWSTKFIDQNGEVTFKEQRRLKGSGGWPLALSFSGDHKRLVSGCMDNGVYLWDLQAEEALQTVRFEHHGWVEDVAWTDKDKAIVSASWDNIAGVFCGNSLAPTFQLTYHNDYVVRVLPVPNTSLVFAGSYDGKVTVWDWEKGRLEAILEGHSDWVTDLLWLGDGLVASLSSDRSVRIWSIEELSQVSFLGDPGLESFELGGEFDLSSFGIGAPQRSSKDDKSPDLDALQSQVVRRFDPADPMVTAGDQRPAMTMLEQAVEKAEDVDADIIDVPDIEEPQETGFGVGDELSDMVWDAISEVDDVSEVVEIDPEFGDADIEEFEDVEDVTRKAFEEVHGDVDIMDSVFDSESDSSAVDEEKHKSHQTGPAPTSGPLYDPKPLGPDDELDELLPDSEELDLAFSSSVVEVDGGDENKDDVPPAVDEDGSVDNKEETSDGQDQSNEEEGPPGKIEPSSDEGANQAESGGGNQNPWMRGRAPTTLTRAKPLAAVDDEEQLREREVEAKENVVLSTKNPPRTRTVPGTAKGAMQPMPGVDDDRWKPTSLNRSALKKMARNLKKKSGKALQAPQSDGASDKTEMIQLDDSQSASWLPEPEAKKQNSVVKQEKKLQIPKPAKKREKEKIETKGKKAGGLSREVKTDEINVEAVAQHDRSESEKEAQKKTDNEKAGEEEKVDTNWGNRTHMWGGRTFSDDEEDQTVIEKGVDEEEVSTGRQFDDFKRREKTLGGRKSQASLSDRLKTKSKLKGRLSKALKLDARVRDMSLGGEETERGADADDVVPSTPTGVGAEATKARDSSQESRLTPGEKFKKDELDVPEPEADEEETIIRRPDGAQLVEVELADLWERATTTAPKMGILKRPIDAGVEYEPNHQMDTGHKGEVTVAVSPQEKRLLTSGYGGEIALWDRKGKNKLRFYLDGSQWLEIGFVESERFIFGVERNGRIHLCLLPQAALGKGTRISHAIIGDGKRNYGCASIDGDGRRILVGGTDGTVQLWSLKTGKCLLTIRSDNVGVSAVAFGKKGPITASVDGHIRFWNDQGMLVDQIDAGAEVRSLATFGTEVLWVEASGALMRMKEGASHAEKLRGHHGEGRSVDFRDDGYCISGGEDGRLLVYCGEGDGDDLAQEMHVPAPIHRVAMTQKTLVVACAGAMVYVFRRRRQ